MRYLVAVVALLFSVSTLAQDNTIKTKSQLGLLLGVAIPTGDFGNKNYQEDKAGLAELGPLFEMNVEYVLGFSNRIGYSWGLTGIIRSQVHVVDTLTLMSNLEKNNPGATFKVVKANPWIVSSLMVGAFTSFPITQNKKLALKTRLGFGLATTISNSIYIVKFYKGNVYIEDQDEAISTAFCFTAGTGLRYEFSNQWGVVLNIDYFATKPKFEDVELTTLGTEGREEIYIDFEKSVTSVNIALGMTYLF